MAVATVAIIVNYNSGGHLARSVRAALAARPAMTVVVVDNDSTDDSLAAATALAATETRLVVLRNPGNQGFARANNQAMAEHEADYYALINPDCEIATDAVAEIITVLESYREIGLASGAIVNPDGTLQKTCRRSFPTPWTGLVRTLGLHRLFAGRGAFADFDRGGTIVRNGEAEYVEAVSGAFMVVRAAALARVGPLDEGYFMHCEDLDWCMRFWQAGFKVAFVPGARAVHHKGGSGRSIRVNWHLHNGMLRFYRKFYRRRYPVVVMWLVYLGVALRFLGQSLYLLLRKFTTTTQRA